MQAQEVLDFWFVEHGPEDWYSGDPEFDARCAARLSDLYERAIRCELWSWRETPKGRLAEIILLDQLSRQFNRGSAKAFASDTMALALAQEIVARGLDAELSVHEKLFAYMPYQHSESLLVQEESLRLFRALGDDQYLPYALEHHDIIARFGRFPLRNAALDRTSTPEELAYVKEREGKAY
ncbi:DUF924 family protein [Pelagibacterium halotolerans]|uniref:Transmembrane protein n=1 Tax=Pelagibacterium halotolerans (strain DSM 22347 / JCM 15775 / CGMCC 1.7692 / B2) TaxID=1082931 RepID=G4R8Q7_PELHB|nr:DUF924 family protein [Pelagibacterium halotolerans]AEQ50343.1 hypothetical protein KKY_298 [Pelagibacterium halotolerans B2]QJR19676.1 DUF924 domain-containing protein [Pelagibacterium halotolerans]SEA98318.1 Uncharacterized conserved protein, DUF924 family [Pelagibacterium halotolerans]